MNKVKTVSFILERDINEENITPIIEYIENCFEECNVEILLKNNMGGDVRCTNLLMQAIFDVKSTPVILKAEGYIVSMAAHLYFYYLIYSKSEALNHVSVQDPENPLLVVYHRPRRSELNCYMGFSDNIIDEAALDKSDKSFIKDTEVSDLLFKEILSLIDYRTEANEFFVNIEENQKYRHRYHHYKDSYYSNFDFVFDYSGVSK